MGNFSFSNRQDFAKLIADNANLFGAVTPTVVELNGNLSQIIDHNKNRNVMYRTYDDDYKEIEIIVNRISLDRIELISNAPLIGYIVIF